MKLGVNSVLFGGHDLETAFKYTQMAGYDGIEISAIDGMKVVVDDAVYTSSIWRGGFASLVDAVTVQLNMDMFDDATGTGVTLTALAGNGIVPAGGGDEWAGCTDVVLPFP